MSVDLNKLKTFYTLAKTKSYTKCADKLFITQSAVSHAIKKLESELGFNLIDRSIRQFRLTPKGGYLFEKSKTIFDYIDDTLNGLSDEKNLPVSITLGVPVEFGSSVLIKGMVPFLKKHSHIHMDFSFESELLEPLLADDIDVIVDCVAHVHEDIVTVPLFREEYAVIAADRYIKENSITEVKDLKNCRLLSFDKNLRWWKNFINALTADAGFGCKSIIQISNVRGIINGALESLGVGFVPKYTVLKELKNGSLVELFPEISIHNDQINIYLKHRNFEKDPFRHLISHIKSLDF